VPNSALAESLQAPYRVLFVDDDPLLLKGLRRMLMRHAASMDMEFVGSGAEALARLEQRPFDAIVTDMRMPVMDGAELLRRVHDAYPGMARLVLSGQADMRASLAALEVAHQYLAKPCRPKVLVAALARARDLHGLLDDDRLRTLVHSARSLPARPRIYSELCRVLADPDYDVSQVAAVVAQDLAIASQVLRLANSALVGSTTPVGRIDRAVVRLGTKRIKALVLASELAKVISAGDRLCGISSEQLNQQSLMVANLAAGVLGGRGEPAEQAFMAGVLHEVGTLLLCAIAGKEFGQIVEEAIHSSVPRHLVEVERMGASHASVGAYLLHLWGLDYPIVEAVAWHHTPRRLEGRGLDAATAVYVSTQLVNQRELMPETLEHLGIDADMTETIARVSANILTP